MLHYIIEGVNDGIATPRPAQNAMNAYDWVIWEGFSACGKMDTPIGSGKSAARKTRVRFLENGAGEAIRTPDPNLGKVVLYP